MKDKVSDVQIYVTKDYKKFKKMTGNRETDPNKVSNIKYEILGANDMTKYAPIIVDQDFEIIDGQHRFEACKAAKKEVHYVISHKLIINNVARLNSNTSNWKNKDYVNCWIKSGIKDFKDLEDIHQDTNISYIVLIGMLHLGKVMTGGGNSEDDNGYTVKEVLQKGKLVIKYRLYTEQMIAMYNELKDFMEVSPTGPFFRSIDIISDSDNFKMDVLLKKLQDSGMKIDTTGSYKNYLKDIEEIYNWRNSKRIALY